jgi:phage baseplate assembly protein W
MKFLGAPYPITRHPRGLFHTQDNITQIKSDLLVLLLTNPGERVMLPEYGTPLNKLMFDPNDTQIATQAREIITQSIKNWEPRIYVSNIEVTQDFEDSLHDLDTMDQKEHILFIRIKFADFDNIQEVQELKLEVPLS